MEGSSFEPIELWQETIKEIGQLMRLYCILKAHNEPDIGVYEYEGKGISAENGIDFELHVWEGTNIITLPGRSTILSPVVFTSEEDSYKQAADLLVTAITAGIKGISIEAATLTENNNATIGFTITEQLTTSSLMTSIYYDLWELIRDEKPLKLCKFCGRPHDREGRGKYCSVSCQHKDKRKREKQVKEMARQVKPVEEIIQYIRRINPDCRPQTIKKWALEGLSD